jgi:CBS domain-containing protein
MAALSVRDIMDGDVPSVYDTDTIDRVLRVMREHELHGIPVVNEGGRCVGIITENDLVMTGEDADLHLPHYFELFGGLVFLEPLSHFEDRLRKATAATAEDLMTPDPVTIEAGAPVQEAARLIAAKKHNRLPVIEHGRLVGVVTRLDVLGALVED